MPIIRRLLLSFFLIILMVFNCGTLIGKIQDVPFKQLKLVECLLPRHHPIYAKLEDLFQDPDMFESPEHFRKAGFHVLSRMHAGLMVASHPSIKNYLIKKFYNKISTKRQLENYLSRVSGARALRNFIHLNHLEHIVVPKKWIYPLPKKFKDSKTEKTTYLLIVERMDLCGSKEEIGQRYNIIDFEILRELCIVLYYFKGLNSTPENMAFTNQNQIAFIDTEKWAIERTEPPLYRIQPYLTEESRQYVSQIFQELEAQDSRQ